MEIIKKFKENLKDWATEDIIKAIEYHSKKYHLGKVEISDAEYDAMIIELKSREPEHPSITTEIGAEPSYGKKIKHPELMGSLEKITYDSDKKTVNDLYKWATDLGIKMLVVTPKIDGVAARLVYENGILVQAATRGNGTIGQDITDNVKMLKHIPDTISYNEKIEIRGEIYMRNSDFREIRDEKLKKGESKIPANPRNMTAGILHQKDPEITGAYPLRFFAYDIREVDYWMIDNEYEFANKFVEKVPEINFVQMDKFMPKYDSVSYIVEKWEKKRLSLDYNIDGLVFAENDIKKQKEHGFKGKCPVGKIAFKFNPEQTKSTLIDIIWQLGRTGKLTPVAQIEPVELDGSTIDSPTLHNYAQIKEKDICIGDEVIIEKAGEIIPQVVRVYQREIKGSDRTDPSVINYPNICPVCHANTSLDKNNVNIWCLNPACTGQSEFRITHFLKTIEVDGVGPGIIQKLIKAKMVNTIPDLYKLGEKEISLLPGMGEKSAKNVVKAIKEKKQIPLAVFLDSLGIKGLGTTTSKIIAKHFMLIDKILMAEANDFEKLDGIGHKTAKNIENGLKDCVDMIYEIKKYGVEIKNDKKLDVGTLTGKSFCITGTLSLPRKDIASQITSHGGNVKPSISKDVDFLVAGDKVGKTKLDKAEKYGIEIINEITLLKMMKDKKETY